MSKYIDRSYDPEDLQKTQEILVEILKDVLRVCDQHQLPVFMIGGTAIGAIRHQGFIPWDDDIDIALLRKDYDRLLEILPDELDEKFGCDHWLKDKDFPAPDACVYAKGTLSVPIEMKNCKYRYGIGLGIFPYDNVSDSAFKAKVQRWGCWFFTRLHWLKVLPKPYIPQKGIKRKIIHAVCTFVHYCLKIIPKKTIVNVCEYFYRKYNDIECKNLNDFCTNNLKDSQIKLSQVFPLVDASFEGINVKLINGYDEALRREYYGDYMQLPPIEQRKNHFPCVLDFGKW